MHNKNSGFLIFILGFMTFFVNGDIYSAAPLVIDIAKDLNITVSEAALSVTAYMLAFGAFTIFLGPLGDRIGKASIIRFCSFGTAIFSCLTLFAPNLGILITLRILNGALAAGIMPVSVAIIGQNFEEKKQHKAIAILMGIIFLGGASATTIGGVISYVNSWRTVYFSYGIAELLGAFLILFFVKKMPNTLNHLNYIDIYKSCFLEKQLIRFLLVLFFSGFFVFGSFTYTGELINQLMDINIFYIGLLLSLFGLGALLGAFLSESVEKKLTNKTCIIAGIGGCISMYSLSNTASLWIIGLSVFSFGTFFLVLHSLVVTTTQNVMPQMKGTVMALISFSVFSGSSMGIIVFKKLMEEGNIITAYKCFSVGFLCLGILATFFIYFQNTNQLQNVVRHKV